MFVVMASAVVLSGIAGGHTAARRVHVAGRISVRVPVGWHVLHGWLSPVADPAPMLSFASFPARLSRRACECGFPNVVNFPRDGVFVFVWEYLHPFHRMLATAPIRPVRFRVAAGQVRRTRTCDGLTDEFVFRVAGRVFQAEVYLGPAVGRELLARAAEVFDSLRIAPDAVPDARQVPLH